MRGRLALAGLVVLGGLSLRAAPHTDSAATLVPGPHWTPSSATVRGIELSVEGGATSVLLIRPERVVAWDSGWIEGGDVNLVHRALVRKHGWTKFLTVDAATVSVVAGEGCDGGAEGYAESRGGEVRFASAQYQLNDDCREGAAGAGATSAGATGAGAAVRFTLHVSEWLPQPVLREAVDGRPDRRHFMKPPRRR